VRFGCGAECVLEMLLQAAGAAIEPFRDIWNGQRCCEMAFHQVMRLGGDGAVLCLCGVSDLRICGGTLCCVDETGRDFGGKARPLGLVDQVQHHVEGGSGTAAGPDLV